MKKLLIFHPTIAPYRIDFFNDLYSSFDTRVCLRYRNLKSQKFDYEKISNQFHFTPIYLKESFKFLGKQMYKDIWKQIDEHNPDIVIAEEYSIYSILVFMHRFFKRKKYKIVTICDDSYNMVAENNDFSRAHRISRRILAPRFDEIILVEQKVTEWYKKRYGKGICFPIIKPEEKTRAEYERIIPLSNTTAMAHGLVGQKVFLFVGRLVAIKNVDMAIRAFSQLDHKKHTFVIVGDGPEKEKLEKLSNELHCNTIFTGRLEGDELNVWYNIAQIFILPSFQEPFGAVTNEALIAGCKSLISEKAGSQCLIENGKNGYTIDPMNVDDIASKMVAISKEVMPLVEVKLKPNQMVVQYKEYMDNLIRKFNQL